MKKNTDKWFHSGRENVSASIAKSGDSIVSQESAEKVDLPDDGKKSPFNEGRGPGRGH